VGRVEQLPVEPGTLRRNVDQLRLAVLAVQMYERLALGQHLVRPDHRRDLAVGVLEGGLLLVVHLAVRDRHAVALSKRR